MARYQKLLIFCLIVIGILSFIFILVKNKSSEESNEALGRKVEAIPTASVTEKFSYICEKEKSAYEVLAAKAQVEANDSSFGKMVTSINGVKQGGGKYWLYSVDEKEATVGASSYLCLGGENINWELK